jgi:D-alanyl-D-alanine carboxypeptidase
MQEGISQFYFCSRRTGSDSVKNFLREFICKMPLSEKELLNITGAPGAHYILVNERETLFACCAGVANIRTNKNITTATTFNHFSVTKTATATATLLLVEQGKINLTDTINTLFPQYPFSYPFTLQQLLSHQAGFANPIPISWIHLPEEEESFDEQQFITQLIHKNAKQKYVPGSKFIYSSIGYLLLSQIIEKLSGERYIDFVQKNILSKVSGTLGFTIPDPALHATGYHPRYSFSNLILGLFMKREKFIAYNHGSFLAFRNILVNGKAYGGFIGNANGLASYLQLFISNSILAKKETQDLMFTEQKGGMALGWFTGNLKGEGYVCHAGGGGGYYGEIRIYPRQRLASILLCNRSSFSDHRLLNKLDGEVLSSR